MECNTPICFFTFVVNLIRAVKKFKGLVTAIYEAWEGIIVQAQGVLDCNHAKSSDVTVNLFSDKNLISTSNLVCAEITQLA